MKPGCDSEYQCEICNAGGEEDCIYCYEDDAYQRYAVHKVVDDYNTNEDELEEDCE